MSVSKAEQDFITKIKSYGRSTLISAHASDGDKFEFSIEALRRFFRNEIEKND